MWRGGGKGGANAPMVFKKGGKEKTLSTFMCRTGVIEISFSFVLNKEMHALRGLPLRVKGTNCLKKGM